VDENPGWIKLHRKILENPIVLKDAEYFMVWVWILLKAAHVEKRSLFNGKEITLKKGQLLTTRKYISNELRINESKVSRILKFFENEQQIRQQTSNRNTLISVTNWDIYQSCGQQNEHPVNNKRTTNEHPVNTIQEFKELKNDKNIYKNIAHPDTAAEELFDKLWVLYPAKKGKGQVSLSAKKRLLKVGYDEMARAIDRYKAELEKDSNWRKPQYGSTFFNSGYIDYLDANYVPDEKTVVKKKGINQFNSFQQRDYNSADLNSIEQRLLSRQ